MYPDGIAKQLTKLNLSKACGPDELPPRLLKLVAEERAPALAFLYQQSTNTGEVPEDGRKAIVTPIYKKCAKSDPANYRPISLTCLCCKILEHVVLSHMAKHLSQHKILLDSQHGFRERLSIVTQLITSVHNWATALEHRGQTDVILLDFSKAFDKVSHQHLSAKLHYYQRIYPSLDQCLSRKPLPSNICEWPTLLMGCCDFWNSPRICVGAGTLPVAY